MSTIKGVDCIAHQRCLLRGGGGGGGVGHAQFKKSPTNSNLCYDFFDCS